MSATSVPAPFGNAGQPSIAEGLATLRSLIVQMGTRTGPLPTAISLAQRAGHAVRDLTTGTRPGIGPATRSSDEVSSDSTPTQQIPVVGPAAQGDEPPDQVPESAGEVWRLVQRAQAGDTDAFGKIYDRYMDTVFRFIYFRVSTRQLAEDLTSETFLRALRRIGSFTWQGRDLGAWLVTIARNLVADHFKSGRYRLEVSTAEVLDADRPERGPEGSPEAAVLDMLTNRTLLEAVKRLNPEQQECIVLRFLQGFSVAETAQTMGKNEGAIKALQYRAVRSLARLLPEGFTK
ncbi:MAG: ECF subfamily RNA polymerase sigma factor, BldN family [Actinocatenispora sp.]